LDGNLVQLGWLNTEKRHHAPVNKVGHLRLHLHIDVLDQHAGYNCEGRERVMVLIELFIDKIDSILVLLMADIIVTLVTSPLLRIVPDHLLNFFLDVF
jgi:hypothetical protein